MKKEPKKLSSGASPAMCRFPGPRSADKSLFASFSSEKEDSSILTIPEERSPCPHARKRRFSRRWAVLAYLALAVLGEGGLTAYTAHPALLALAIVTFALGGASLFTQAISVPATHEDRANRWVLIVFAVAGLLLGYVPALTDRLDILTLNGETLRWFGVALYAVGGALRIAPVFVLGRRFSGLVAIQPNHTLVTMSAEERLLADYFGQQYEA